MQNRSDHQGVVTEFGDDPSLLKTKTCRRGFSSIRTHSARVSELSVKRSVCHILELLTQEGCARVDLQLGQPGTNFTAVLRDAHVVTGLLELRTGHRRGLPQP